MAATKSGVYRVGPVSVHPHSRGGYRIRWADPDNKSHRHQEYRADFGEACERARRVELELRRDGDAQPIQVRERTVRNLHAQMIAADIANALSNGTIKHRKYNYWKHIDPVIGSMRVTRWRPSDSERVIARLRSTGYKPNTIMVIGGTMRALVTRAQKLGWLERDQDPMWGVAYTSGSKQQGNRIDKIESSELPTETDIENLIDAFYALNDPDWAAAVVLMRYTGIRIGELARLRGNDFDFSTLLVRVDEAADADAEGWSLTKDPKNKKTRRVLLHPDGLGEVERLVERRIAADGPDALIWPRTNTIKGHVIRDLQGTPKVRRVGGKNVLRYPPVLDADGKVQYSVLKCGEFINPTSVGRKWDEASRVAKWPRTTKTMIRHNRSMVCEGPRWTPHSLRHFAASWMLFDIKYQPEDVSRFLGHSSVAFTMARYVDMRGTLESKAEQYFGHQPPRRRLRVVGN